jgi:beta-galactosidase
MPRNSRLKWAVPYEPGYIEVRGYNGGTLAATKRVETVGRAAAVRLTPDRTGIKADSQDVSMVTIEIVDEQGRIVPTAGNVIMLRATGGGKIIGVCNGDPSCHINESETTYPAFNGRLMVFVQAGTDAGPITLEATSVGLEEAGTTITTKQYASSPSLP